MNHSEAIAYLLKNDYRMSLIDKMSKNRCIEVAIIIPWQGTKADMPMTENKRR